MQNRITSAGTKADSNTNDEVTTYSQTIAKPNVSCRFSIIKTILSDFALFAIVDNEMNKVVCHLVYDNGYQYCDEMANKMLDGLNSSSSCNKK
jgi:hypothetical protein